MSRLLGYPRRTIAVDLTVIASVVAMLVGIHLLTSPDQKTAMTIDSLDAASPTLFTAAYVHFGEVHLATNAVGYLSASVMAYLLCLQHGRREWFYWSFLSILVLVPLLVNGGTAILFTHWGDPVPVSARGFSGSVAAFGGFVFVAVVGLVWDRSGPTVAVGVCGLLGSLLTLQAYFQWMGSPSVAVLGALVTAAAANGTALAVLEGVPRNRTEVASSVQTIAPVLFAYALLATFVAGLFPTDVTRNGMILNVYAHAIGVACGLIVSLVSAVALSAWNRDSIFEGIG